MQSPPGALCAKHPDVHAVATCDRCGAFACVSCTTFAQGERTYCPSCPENKADWVRAEVSTRFLANLVDQMVVVLPLVAATVAVIFGSAITASLKNTASDVSLAVLIPAAGLLTLASIGVQLYCQITYGRSLAKLWLGLRVVRRDGSPVELWRIIVLRNLVVHVLAQACGFVGLIDALMIFGEERRCLHDHFADTIVVVDRS